LRGEIISEPLVKTRGKRSTCSFLFRARFHDQEDKIYARIINPVGELLKGDELVLIGKLRKFYSSRGKSRDPIRFSFLGIGQHSYRLIKENRWQRMHAKLKRSFVDRFNDLLPDPEAGLLHAMILGERSTLDPKIKSDFRKLGISHIISISGFHVAVAALFFYWLGRLFLLGSRASLIMSLMGVVFFFCIAGGRPPALRALLMIATFLIGRLLGRTGSGLNALSVSFLIMLLIDPGNLFSLSFQLSYVVVFGILLSYELFSISSFRGKHVTWGRRIFSFFKENIRIPLVAFIFSYGLIAHIWGGPSGWVVLVNMILAPLFTIIIGLGILLLGTLWLGSLGGGFFSLLVFIPTKLLVEVSGFLASQPLFQASGPLFSTVQTYLYYGVLTLLALLWVGFGRRLIYRLQKGLRV